MNEAALAELFKVIAIHVAERLAPLDERLKALERRMAKAEGRAHADVV